MDSIIKNVGKVYAPLFSPNLIKNFRCAFESVSEKNKKRDDVSLELLEDFPVYRNETTLVRN